jgi:hypothetical protein
MQRQIDLERRAEMEDRQMTSKELTEYRQLGAACKSYGAAEDLIRGTGVSVDAQGDRAFDEARVAR